MRAFLPYVPDQIFLFPVDPREWLPRDHFVYFVRDIVADLDLTEIYAMYGDGAGAPAFDPRMMTALLLYGYATGVRPSRELARLCATDVAFRVLTAHQQPDFRTIALFRKRHLQAIEALFPQILAMCEDAGLVRMRHVAIDGTKIEANASKHKAMSLERLRKREKELREDVRKYLREAEEEDAKDEAELGDRSGYQMPPELVDRQARLKWIRDKRKQLEERERKEADEAGRKDKTPRETAQWNFTDPDSRIMPSSRDKGAFVQAYNAQLAVDADSHVIVATTLAQSPIDSPQLPRVLAKIEENTGRLPDATSQDAGYASAKNIVITEALGIDGYFSVAKHKRDQITDPAPRGPPPRFQSWRDWMKRKVSTARGKAAYAERKQTVEPVIGQLKEARGFRRFLLRGRANAQGEWTLACTAHNLLKLFGTAARPA